MQKTIEPPHVIVECEACHARASSLILDVERYMADDPLKRLFWWHKAPDIITFVEQHVCQGNEA